MKLVNNDSLKTLLNKLKEKLSSKKEIKEVDDNTKTYVTEINASEILMTEEEKKEIVK